MRSNMTMPKDAYINARVDKRTKSQAQKVLSQVGMSTTEAINLFLKQIVLHKGLPFDVRVPKQKILEDMAALDAGEGEVFTGSTQAFMENMLKSDD